MPDEKRFEHKGKLIRAEMETCATPQKAWEAWAVPEKIAQWFVDRASGEAKPGGTMTWFFDNFGYVLPFKVLDAVPGELLVLKWDPPEGISGLLEVRITREGGSTCVRLIQSGFRGDAKWDEEYEGTASGWQMSLAILRHYLEHYFGQPKKQLLVTQPATFEYEQLRTFFLDASKLSQWLITAGFMGKTGDACQLTLRDAGKLTGRVLAVTKWEVALSWEEIEGTLELKGFSMGLQRVVGVRCMSWKQTADEMKQLESKLGAAVERLAALFPARAAAAEGAGGKSSFEEK
ncbi:MAG TPA: SRPBCC domain-containing protein [Candidatus Limnocylindria bacterium]|nr:SRPBCC domain-containing protein [Candidatus Limnocylindria bacterium]